jgi:putative transposase
MINRAHKLPISRQAELLGISRASVYYLPRPVSENDLTIMRRLDELHLRYPFMGARMLRDQLNRQGIDIGRKHVSTLMKKSLSTPYTVSLIRVRNNQDTRFTRIY